MARAVASSKAQAEKLTIEVFETIWRYAEQYERSKLCEKDFVETIAAYRLARYIRSKPGALPLFSMPSA
jgi:hypothetical protein